jgi:signal transduction histidine kinase
MDCRRVASAIDAIERNTLTQARLIDDLLDLSRAAGGKLDVDLELLDFGQLVRQVARWLDPQAEAAGVIVEEAIGESELPVIGDRVRLQQVISNLTANALKFTPAGGRVVVETRREDQSVVLAVRDTGHGIAAATLPHVFEVFHQGSTSERRRGLGLGLTIAKHIVELHHGTIGAESAGAGHGATLTVRLPLATGAR